MKLYSSIPKKKPFGKKRTHHSHDGDIERLLARPMRSVADALQKEAEPDPVEKAHEAEYCRRTENCVYPLEIIFEGT